MDRNDPALIEECHLRAHRFWSLRHMPLAWPIEPLGYTFLGNVVHLVGADLFPEWTGLEPKDMHEPSLKTTDFRYASPIEKDFAALVLMQFDTANSPRFSEIVKSRVKQGQPMLSQEEWNRAKKLFSQHVEQRQQIAGFRMSAVMRGIVEGAGQQKLSMATRLSNGEIVASPSTEWATEWAYSRLAECQMNPTAPFVKTLPGVLHGIALPRWQVDLLPGNEWIFVETKSLEAYLGHLSNNEAPIPEKAGSEPEDNQVARNTNNAGTKKPARHIAIGWAVEVLWKGHVPDGITVGQRDSAIIDLLKEEGKAVPSEKTIARFFQRQ